MKTSASEKSVEVALREENLRLKHAVDELSILNDLARTIGGSRNSEEVIQTIIRRSLRAVNAEQGVITLVEQEEDRSMKTLVRTMIDSIGQEKFHLDQNLIGWMYLNKKPLIVDDPMHDSRFRGVQWDVSVRSVLCVPMMVKSELKGVLTVYNKKDGKKFTEDDQRLLAIIAAQSAQVVENTRLYEREKELLVVEEDIRLASKIQYDLLPKESPQIQGYDIAGVSIPAQLVGGDYFDFIPIDEQTIAFCIGDVSGKGLPASLLMANVQATLRGQTILKPSAKECIERSNKLLHASTNSEKFVTLFYGVLDSKNHQFCYSNAGHDNPILISPDNDVVRLGTGGVVLGIMADFPFEEETITLHPSTLFVAYSDGITEAMNENQTPYDEKRLLNIIKKNRDSSARNIISNIIDDIKLHTGNYPQSDDMTLVVMRRLNQ